MEFLAVYNWYGVVPGISTNVDLDVFNGSSSTLQNYVIGGYVAGFLYWDPQGTTGGNPYTGSMSGSWEGAESNHSASVSTIPHNPAIVDSVFQQTADQISVQVLSSGRSKQIVRSSLLCGRYFETNVRRSQ